MPFHELQLSRMSAPCIFSVQSFHQVLVHTASVHVYNIKATSETQ
jgi:hypothetical protein